MSHTDYETRWAIDPDAAALMGTDELRDNFLIEQLFVAGRTCLTCSHSDRMIVGGAAPAAAPLRLEAIKPTGTANFLDRRELIAVNIGGPGSVTVDGQRFAAGNRDMLYVGMGAVEVDFASDDAAAPARFYLLSAPAHASHPSTLIRQADARRLDLGDRKSTRLNSSHVKIS